MENQKKFFEAVKENNYNLVVELSKEKDVDITKNNSFFFAANNNFIDILKFIINNSDFKITINNSWLLSKFIKNKNFEELDLILKIKENKYEIKNKLIDNLLDYSYHHNEFLFRKIFQQNEIDLIRLLNKTSIKENKNSELFFSEMKNKIISANEEDKVNLLYSFIKYDFLECFKFTYKKLKNKNDSALLNEIKEYYSFNIFKYLNNLVNYKPFELESLMCLFIENKKYNFLELIIDNPKLDLGYRFNKTIISLAKNINEPIVLKLFLYCIKSEKVNAMEEKCIVFTHLVMNNRFNLINKALNNPYAILYNRNLILEQLEYHEQSHNRLKTFFKTIDF